MTHDSKELPPDAEHPINYRKAFGGNVPQPGMRAEGEAQLRELRLEYARRLNDIAASCEIDGREGDANDLYRIAKRIAPALPAASPAEATKPAPDAMREALRVIGTMAVCEEGETAGGRELIVDACREIALNALKCSTPVPPPATRDKLAARVQEIFADTLRWRPRGSVSWIYDPHPGWFDEHKHEIEWESLYSSPQHVGRETTVLEFDDQDPPMKWLIDTLRQLACDLLADPKTPWIGERDPKQHICWTAADRLSAVVSAHDAVLEECAKIALAIDSGRGNEKEIANAIRSLTEAKP